MAPGGELKHGTLGQESYTNKADTYGLMLSLDRRDIINDDLGAITTVPRKLGRGSGLKINDVFWTTFLANTAFFAAGNSNLLTGADTALSIDGTTKAEGRVPQPGGRRTASRSASCRCWCWCRPRSPRTRRCCTRRWRSATRPPAPSTRSPTRTPASSGSRSAGTLSNTQFTGNSDKAWYLLADPNDLPVIEVAFLNGQESPTIETAEADFHVLGVQMRGYHDFGVGLQDPRGGVKNKGEA